MQRRLALSLFAFLVGCTSSTSPACAKFCVLVVHREIECQVLATADEEGEVDGCEEQLDDVDDAQCTKRVGEIRNESCEDLATEACPTVAPSARGSACP